MTEFGFIYLYNVCVCVCVLGLILFNNFVFLFMLLLRAQWHYFIALFFFGFFVFLFSCFMFIILANDFTCIIIIYYSVIAIIHFGYISHMVWKIMCNANHNWTKPAKICVHKPPMVTLINKWKWFFSFSPGASAYGSFYVFFFCYHIMNGLDR